MLDYEGGTLRSYRWTPIGLGLWVSEGCCSS
ncbi:hypothetical protein LINPERHAP2_LOCUS27720 [Linum perenne]